MASLSWIAVNLLLAASPAPKGVEVWTPVGTGTAKDVRVWTRTIPESTMQEMKADMVVDATPEAVWSTLVAVHRYPDFLKNTVYARVMRKVSQAEHLEYRRYTKPQISYYDVVLDVTTQEDATENTYYMQWNCLPGASRPDAVRMNACHGAWAVEPAEHGQTHVMYWNAVDPKGRIPSVLFNAAEEHDLPDMLRQVAKHAASAHVAIAF